MDNCVQLMAIFMSLEFASKIMCYGFEVNDSLRLVNKTNVSSNWKCGLLIIFSKYNESVLLINHSVANQI